MQRTAKVIKPIMSKRGNTVVKPRASPRCTRSMASTVNVIVQARNAKMIQGSYHEGSSRTEQDRGRRTQAEGHTQRRLRKTRTGQTHRQADTARQPDVAVWLCLSVSAAFFSVCMCQS